MVCFGVSPVRYTTEDTGEDTSEDTVRYNVFAGESGGTGATARARTPLNAGSRDVTGRSSVNAARLCF